VKALPHFVGDESVWRMNMFKNYLLTTLRNLKKNSTFSLLNILGLVVGIAVFIAAGAAALMIAYLTVSYQSIKSARANPVKSLKYE
jgi:hypothetical protein